MGPKRSLETNFSQQGYLPGDKRFWPNFFRIIDCDKPRGTFYKGPQGILTFTIEVVRSFL